ncbi:MAG: hypothetical protein JWO00_626 [Candidatus Parcubacteria bacterium]|nr:hypothetical protein [Candidatus Parcubacteria bacterium]
MSNSFCGTRPDEGTISSGSIRKPGLIIGSILGVGILAMILVFGFFIVRSMVGAHEPVVSQTITNQPTAQAVTYTKQLVVGSEWVGVEIPAGYSMDSAWGNAPLDVRINRDNQRVWIMPKNHSDYGTDVGYKEYRMNAGYSGTARVTLVFRR